MVAENVSRGADGTECDAAEFCARARARARVCVCVCAGECACEKRPTLGACILTVSARLCLWVLTRRWSVVCCGVF